MRALPLLLLALPAAPAWAFSFESQLSDGCHERLTLDALAVAGWPGGLSPPRPTGIDARALDDLQFELPARSREAWTMALLIGVRDNDLRGRAPTDLPGLSEIHNDLESQAEHCLRGPRDDGTAGDASALAACREFIRAETLRALGEDVHVDLEATEAVEVTLAFSGQLELPVRRFGFHAGRALHALQDGFTHTFRSSDGLRVRHVLNFVDPARTDDYHAERDGFVHLAELDLCEDTPPGQDLRVRVARQASTEYLRALALREGGTAGRMARVEAVLDAYLSLEPGCDASNRWCDAPEVEAGCGCTAVAAPEAEMGMIGVAVLMMLVARGRRGRITRAPAPAGALLLLLFALAAPARAEPSSTTTSSAALVKPDSPSTGEWGLYGSLSAALDEAAFAGAVGVRWQWLDDLTLGVDAEYNPWLSIDAGRVSPGTFNGYATLVYRWWAIGDVDLRLTGHVGVSVLLFDLVGADAGSVGPYFGLSLLGVSFRVSDDLVVVLDPADIAFPIPNLAGVPFTYRQYRITAGLQWNL